ncbi:MAG TPA: HAD-IIIA family hydrolase [Burkholderiaceae bacterium]|nr:HAD-IIIA family hydrolase [Burkholderiaceae bacterium]
MTALERAALVRLMILDVDGVLTDGRLYYGAGGEAMKAFDVRDGHGIKLLREGGVEVAILTARQSEIVAVRARELGVERVVQGAADKLAGFERLLTETRMLEQRCGYIGDDWPDLAVLARVGFAATVADGAPEVRAAAHWVAAAAGGHGAVRELAEFVLRAQGLFSALLARHAGASRA